MTDPPRLLEGAGLAGSLLRAGAEELPSRDTVRKAALALGAGAAVASTAAAAGGATGIAAGTGSAVSKASVPFTFAVLAKWLGIGTLAGVVTVTSASQVARVRSAGVALQAPAPKAAAPVPSPSHPGPAAASDDLDVPAPPEIETIAGSSSTPSVIAPEPQRAKASDRASDIEAFPSKRPPASREANPTTEPTSAPARETLPPEPPSSTRSDDGARAFAPEIAFVDRAWQAWQRGNSDEAIADLVGYELRFPDLRLHPEVLFLRMEAERRRGHDEAAAMYARQIVTVYPKSAQAARARSILTGR
jgi:hypothetical protein